MKIQLLLLALVVLATSLKEASSASLQGDLQIRVARSAPPCDAYGGIYHELSFFVKDILFKV